MAIFEQAGEQLRVPVQLEPYGSAFIVFRSAIPQRHLQAIVKEGTAILGTNPFPEAERKLYKEVADNFSISFWAKPEFNIMLSTRNFMENINDPWTDYFTIYPPSGIKHYGSGHATAGLAVGRNGVAVWEHGSGKPVLALAAPTSISGISGWSHIALVYQDGVPSVYVNGKFIEKGKESGDTIHPGLGLAFLEEGASYYNGDMSDPQVFSQALRKERLRQLAAEEIPERREWPELEMAAADGTPGLLFWQNGDYSLTDNKDRDTGVSTKGSASPWLFQGPGR
jgi:hypothetical protein